MVRKGDSCTIWKNIINRLKNSIFHTALFFYLVIQRLSPCPAADRQILYCVLSSYLSLGRSSAGWKMPTTEMKNHTDTNFFIIQYEEVHFLQTDIFVLLAWLSCISSLSYRGNENCKVFVIVVKVKVNLTARNSFSRSSMLPLWMVKRAAAIWLMALARQWMLLQWPVGGSECTR